MEIKVQGPRLAPMPSDPSEEVWQMQRKLTYPQVLRDKFIEALECVLLHRMN